MGKRVKFARLKANRSYEVEELAERVGVTAQTVRAWIKDGMPALTEKRPYLIIGQEAKVFLKAREEARKAPRAKKDFYCLSCKARCNAAFGLTEEVVLSNGRRMMTGFCEVCEAPCNRFLSGEKAAKGTVRTTSVLRTPNRTIETHLKS